MNQEIRVGADGQIQMTDLLCQGNENGKAFSVNCKDLGVKIPSINSIQTTVMNDLANNETLTAILSDPTLTDASSPDDARKALREVCLARESAIVKTHVNEQMGTSRDLIQTVIGHQLSANHKTEKMF
jgi:hypothetical protein